jgi:hypothetical protein
MGYTIDIAGLNAGNPVTPLEPPPAKPVVPSGSSVPLSNATPQDVAAVGSPGTAGGVSRADHVHGHGVQADPTYHAPVTATDNGFMSSADKVKLDAATAAATPTTLMMRDSNGDTNVRRLYAAEHVLAGAGTLALPSYGFTGSGGYGFYLTAGEVRTVTNSLTRLRISDTAVQVANGAVFTGSGSGLTNLNASELASGTVPDARFPATLPAISGVNLTALNATQLTSGTVPEARLPGTINGTKTWTGIQILEAVSPRIQWHETDATLPAGRWRFLANADNLTLQRNTAVDGSFSTSVGELQFLAAGGVSVQSISGDGSGLTGVVADNAVLANGFHVESGTYTPTLTNGTNVAASTSTAAATWIRIGDIVFVSMRISLDPTSAAVTTTLGISLPVASNLGSITNLSGVATRSADTIVDLSSSIFADIANDRASMSFRNDSDLNNRAWAVQFQYQILA